MMSVSERRTVSKRGGRRRSKLSGQPRHRFSLYLDVTWYTKPAGRDVKNRCCTTPSQFVCVCGGGINAKAQQCHTAHAAICLAQCQTVSKQHVKSPLCAGACWRVRACATLVSIHPLLSPCPPILSPAPPPTFPIRGEEAAQSDSVERQRHRGGVQLRGDVGAAWGRRGGGVGAARGRRSRHTPSQNSAEG